MKMMNFLVVPLYLLFLCSTSAGQEKGKLIDIVGCWVAESSDSTDLMITKNGEKYVVKELKSGIESIGVLKEDLMLLKTEAQEITFSSDGKTASMFGVDYQLARNKEELDKIRAQRKLTEEKVKSRQLADPKEEMHRNECILHIRSIQQMMRGHANMKGLKSGDALDPATLAKSFGELPKCPAGGKYTLANKVTEEGVLYCTCSLSQTKNHEPDEYSKW